MDRDNDFSTGKQTGDYLIGKPLARGSSTATWVATQVSVQREVLLCSLNDELKKDATHRKEFMADVRTKASVDHPFISSVLEAVSNDTQCFFAEEKLHGTSVATLHTEGVAISPINTARIIRNIANAYKHIENQGIATLPMTTNDIIIDDAFHCRLINLAVCGTPDPANHTGDKHLISQVFQDLLKPNQLGSTRTASLLGYMANPDPDQTLTWTQIHDLSDEVERELAEPIESNKIPSPTMRLQSRSHFPNALFAKILSALAITAILAGLIYLFTSRMPLPKERKMPDMVHIAAGKYPGPDGFPVSIREFWIGAHEVTIGEYAKFLQALDILSDQQKTVYQHDDQPEDKISHEPDDWSNLYSAAKAGETWNGLTVDLNYPVVGVDWWDAYVYAVWKSHRLPAREEWYAACSASTEPSKLIGTGWLPADQAEKTGNGIYGLAGNVSEWMRKRSLDPANPSKPARYSISGSSYLRPKYGARSREWVDDRSLRRADLGFRTSSMSPQDG